MESCSGKIVVFPSTRIALHLLHLVLDVAAAFINHMEKK